MKAFHKLYVSDNTHRSYLWFSHAGWTERTGLRHRYHIDEDGVGWGWYKDDENAWCRERVSTRRLPKKFTQALKAIAYPWPEHFQWTE